MLAQIKQIFRSLDLENKDKITVAEMSFTIRYAWLGALFGFLFPLMAMGILLLIRALPFNLFSIMEMQHTEPLLWIIDTAPFFLGLFASFAGRREDRLRQAYALLKQEESELQAATRQLQVRTEQLLLSSEVSSHLSTIINLDEMLAEVVNQIKEKFGYYQAHIYLLNEETRELALAEGIGLEGQEMKTQSHHIVLDTSPSLIARAARTGVIVRVDNMAAEADWLPNPLLPDTYSEMAVPIKIERQVVGVLDVLKDEISGLDEKDADILSSLANQVAMAIHNARLFAQVETALAKARAAQERYSKQLWEKTRTASGEGQYLYVNPDTPPPDKRGWEAMAEIEQKALAQKHTVVVEQNLGGEILATPINLHNKMIGTLQLHPASKGLTWDEDDVALVEAVVDQLAQTAENLRLFDETRQRANREQTIRQITDKMRTATRLDDLIKITAKELGQLFSTDYTLVELGVEKAAKDNT
jgi:GAF domain-containing protein